MKTNDDKTAQMGLWQEPVVSFPTVRIPQPDGSVLLRPGKPVVVGREITTREFAERTGISQEYAAQLCGEGIIRSRRKSPKKTSMFLIPLEEVEAYLTREI